MPNVNIKCKHLVLKRTKNELEKWKGCSILTSFSILKAVNLKSHWQDCWMTKVWRAVLTVKYKPLQEKLISAFIISCWKCLIPTPILRTRSFKGTRSISKQTENIRLNINKQVRCQEVTKTRQHSSRSSQMWYLKTKMYNLSSQTATVPEEWGVSLLQMMTLEMMLGNTDQSFTSLGKKTGL